MKSHLPKVRRTSEQMFPILSRYDRSEQSQSDFCNQEGISLGVFQYWLRQYRNSLSAEPKNNFDQLEILSDTPDQNEVVITTPSGLVIQIPLS